MYLYIEINHLVCYITCYWLYWTLPIVSPNWVQFCPVRLVCLCSSIITLVAYDWDLLGTKSLAVLGELGSTKHAIMNPI